MPNTETTFEDWPDEADEHWITSKSGRFRYNTFSGAFEELSEVGYEAVVVGKAPVKAPVARVIRVASSTYPQTCSVCGDLIPKGWPFHYRTMGDRRIVSCNKLECADVIRRVR